MRVLRSVRVVMLLAVFVGLSSSLLAGTMGLRWSAVEGANGYRVYYGPASGSYSGFVDVGNVLDATLEGLPDCTSHYVAVKAYNAAGESAQFSNELSGWPRPAISTYDPAQVRQGELLTLNVTGTNFQPGADLALVSDEMPTDVNGDPLIRIESVSVSSCSQLQALIAVEPGARGFRAMEVGSIGLDIEIVNPDNVFGARVATLNVQFGEERADINRSDSGTRDRIDGKDLVWQARAHGSSQGDSTYSPDADLDGDGWVDGDDLVFLAARFGKCWTGTGWSGTACQ